MRGFVNNPFYQRLFFAPFQSVKEFFSVLKDERRAALNVTTDDKDRFVPPIEVEDEYSDFRAVLGRLKRPPEFFSSDRQLRQHDRADWQHTNPKLRRFYGALQLELRKKYGIPMYAHSAFRTKAEQNGAKARGVSNLTWPRAPHCLGMAVDMVSTNYAWELTKAEWFAIGVIGKRVAERLDIDVVWGGDWTRPYDPAHWELAEWRETYEAYKDFDIEKLEAETPVRRTPTVLARS